jgi:spore germination cell wall hydrolase CwlJ-like protein
MTGPHRLAACAIFLFGAAGVHADAPASQGDGLAARMAAMIGSERAALAALPSAHVETLASAGTAASDRAAPVGRAANVEIAFSHAELAALPVADGGAEWACLTRALYFEARGESIPGQVAVGEVVLNRVDSTRYPDTVCGVVEQGAASGSPCQFSFMCDGHAETVTEPAAWRRAGKIARLLIDGAPRALTDGATYFHNTAVRPAWSRVFTRTARIGEHIFYRDPDKITSR